MQRLIDWLIHRLGGYTDNDMAWHCAAAVEDHCARVLSFQMAQFRRHIETAISDGVEAVRTGSFNSPLH